MAQRANTFRRQINVMVQGALSPQAIRAQFVLAARGARDDLIAAGRASTVYTTATDGTPGRDDNLATHVIQYQFSYMAEIVLFALTELRRRSPVASGRYQQSFRVAVDGAILPAGSVTADSIPPRATIVIYSPEPYSRKIDVQMVGRTALHFSAPPNLFAETAKAVKARYGNTVQAYRTTDWLFPGQWVRKSATKSTAIRRRRPKEGIGRIVENPALVLVPFA